MASCLLPYCVNVKGVPKGATKAIKQERPPRHPLRGAFSCRGLVPTGFPHRSQLILEMAMYQNRSDMYSQYATLLPTFF